MCGATDYVQMVQPIGFEPMTGDMPIGISSGNGHGLNSRLTSG